MLSEAIFAVSVPPGLIEILKYIFAGGVPFTIAYFYWVDLDRRTESFDEDCRKSIEEDSAFRGVKDNLEYEYIITSDSPISKAVTNLKRATPQGTGKPDKILPVDEDSFEERKKIIISERAKEITPGKNVLDSELTVALQDYYAWRLAIAREDVDSDVIAHFRSNLEDYKHSNRVYSLRESENYEEVNLLGSDGDSLNTLDDVFLPLISRVESSCVDTSDVEAAEQEFERCRKFLMLCFWGLYRKNMKGVLYSSQVDGNKCLNECRRSIREENNIGYWLLTKDECDQDLFEEFCHLGWKFKQIIDEYWDFDNCYKLHPPGEDITDLTYVECPFFIYHKDKDEFDPDDPVRERKRGSHKFRRKEEYKD